MTSSAESVVAIVGAGPAGLAAAVAAASSGARVVLVDAGAQLGGQYWRQGAGGLRAGLHHDVDVFAGLSSSVEQLIASGQLTHLPQCQIWSLTADPAIGGTAYAIDRRDPLNPVEVSVDWATLVLAPGAFDRPVPFPGWDLPGVITVGAAQSLLKGSGVVVGPRVLIAGTGPFLLPVAAALTARGADVVGVCEANHPLGWLRRLPALLSSPGRIGEAVGYLATLARHRVRVRNRTMIVAAHGADRLEAVTIARLDRHGRRTQHPTRRVATDVLAVGYGFSSQSELAQAAGCRMRVTAEQTLAVVVDEQQASSNPRVFAAGEITGIGGAALAVAEGTIAGASAARVAVGGRPASASSSDADPRPRVRQLRRFAAAMHTVYPVPSAWLDNLDVDTVVCRCEEVDLAEIDRAIELGARDARTVKLLSRAGMGWCQGRECGYAVACILGRRTDRPPDLTSGTERPVATPIPLGLVAQDLTESSS
jgi:NADPH-dependent 2,4-dienoyl-CoA reductase/sulfur reductase-like enzyme